jgi:hypothetical protein
MYPHPTGCAGGAEWAAHEFLLAAKRRGHEAGFWLRGARQDYELEGIPVWADAPKGRVDWVIGQLGNEHAVSMFAKRSKAQLGWMLHAPNQLPPRCDVVLANSQHVHAVHPESLLLRPHVPEYRYEGHERGTAVTLVNLSKWKGAQTLHDLVTALPTTRFLGVRGAWDAQRWKAGRYENLTVWDCQPVMDTVLAATRILLMPSASESWGRVGVEAAWRGIPTIAHPCDGIKESLGPAAVYAERSDTQAWVEAVRDLQVPTVYATRRAAARNRARLLEVLTMRDAQDVLRVLESRVL